MMAVLHSRLTHIERNQALFDEVQVSEKLSAVYQDTLKGRLTPEDKEWRSKK